MRSIGKFTIKVLAALFVLVCSQAALAVAHAFGWYPDQQLAALLLASPTALQIEWVQWSLLAVLTVGLWLTIDYFVYQREILGLLDKLRLKSLKVHDTIRSKLFGATSVVNIPPVVENAPGLVWKKLKHGWQAQWRAQAGIAKRGYTPKKVRLWQSTKEILEPDEISKEFIAQRCRVLQDDMLLYARHSR